MQEKLNRQDVRVRAKYAGGKTLSEVRTSMKEKLSERQLRRIQAKLIRMGELEDLTPDLRGRGAAHRFIPTGDSFGAIKPHSRSGTNPTFDYNGALELIYKGTTNAIAAIRASSRNRSQARSRDICSQHIKPVVNDVYQLRATRIVDLYCKVLVPGEFFTTADYDSYWTRRARSKERKGTLRVRHPRSNNNDDWFFPTLEDWERYFADVASILADKHNAHLLAQYKRNQDETKAPLV